LELLVADEGDADGEEGFVDVGAPVVATVEAALTVQPGDSPLDDPAFFAEPGAVFGLAFCDPWCDPAFL
jgi:hypothetical protein